MDGALVGRRGERQADGLVAGGQSLALIPQRVDHFSEPQTTAFSADLDRPV